MVYGFTWGCSCIIYDNLVLSIIINRWILSATVLIRISGWNIYGVESSQYQLVVGRRNLAPDIPWDINNLMEYTPWVI